MPRLHRERTVQKGSAPRYMVQAELVSVASPTLPHRSADHSSESNLPATVCINANTNKVGGYHMILQVTNLQNNGRNLRQTECENGLMSEINSCPPGGQSDKWGWKFRYVKLTSDLGAKCLC